MVQFQENLYFWNGNKKLSWMDQTNVQNLRKNSNANVLEIHSFALHMWVTIWAGKPDGKRNVFILWRECACLPVLDPNHFNSIEVNGVQKSNLIMWLPNSCVETLCTMQGRRHDSNSGKTKLLVTFGPFEIIWNVIAFSWNRNSC